MATAQQIMTRAARMIGVKQTGQPLSAEDNEVLLELLNAMLIRWEADGLALGFSSVSAATATLPIPTEAEEGVAANLAVRAAPEFQTSARPEIVALADQGLRALERDVIKPVAVVTDVPSAGHGYDINTDS